MILLYIIVLSPLYDSPFIVWFPPHCMILLPPSVWSPSHCMVLSPIVWSSPPLYGPFSLFDSPQLYDSHQ